MGNPRKNPEAMLLWRSLMTVSDMSRNEEKTTGNQLGNLSSPEGKALWRQRQAYQNMVGHQATEMLKAAGLTWNGLKKKKR